MWVIPKAPFLYSAVTLLSSTTIFFIRSPFKSFTTWDSDTSFELGGVVLRRGAKIVIRKKPIKITVNIVLISKLILNSLIFRTGLWFFFSISHYSNKYLLE